MSYQRYIIRVVTEVAVYTDSIDEAIDRAVRTAPLKTQGLATLIDRWVEVDGVRQHAQ